MDLVEQAKENAKENFKSGLNCSEAILKAVLDCGVADFPPEVVAMATGFGGGMGLSGNNCGALTGGIMAIGAVHGRQDPKQGEFRDRVKKLYGNPGLYRYFNVLPHRFTERFGHVDCKGLNEGHTEWMDKNRFKNCLKIVIGTAEMVMEHIIEGQENGYTQPFGKNMAGKV